jgi:hypothetical protein
MRRSSVDGKFIGNRPVDRIREGLKVDFKRREAVRSKGKSADDWDLNPARCVTPPGTDASPGIVILGKK